ncbi:MAG: hypothetical protein ACR2IR_09445 [Acidimicrobiia bacterium]
MATDIEFQGFKINVTLEPPSIRLAFGNPDEQVAVTLDEAVASEISERLLEAAAHLRSGGR